MLKKVIIYALIIFTAFSCRDDDELFKEVKSFNDNVIITSQEELDLFSESKYNRIVGNLTISDNITSLTGLIDLNEVLGDLIIINTNLTTLEGLNNLNKVTGVINIYNTPNITDFCALQPLFTSGEYNAGTVDIANNGFNPTEAEIIQGNCSQ